MKSFLKNNEVYFTTLAALSLSIMAIIVSINSNKIAKRQSQIDYFDKAPDFYISSELILNDKTNFFDGLHLTVSKLGGKAKNINVDNISFLDIKLVDSVNNELNQRFLVLGYFDAEYRTGVNEGNIIVLRGSKNNKQLFDLKKDLEQKFKEQGYAYALFDEKLFVKIRYLNFLNEIKIEYFDMSSGQGNLIERFEEVRKLFETKLGFINNKKVIELWNVNQKNIREIIKQTIEDS